MPPSCLPFSRYYPTTRDAPPRSANLSPTLLLASSEGSLRAPVGKPFGFYPRGPCEPCDCWPITSARCPLNTHSGTTHHNGIVHRSSSPSSFWFLVGVHLLPDEPHHPSRGNPTGRDCKSFTRTPSTPSQPTMENSLSLLFTTVQNFQACRYLGCEYPRYSCLRPFLPG